MQMKNSPLYFRLLPNSHASPPRSSKALSPSEMVGSIVHRNHYIYIDVNEESGLREMEPIRPAEAGPDTQTLGSRSYVCAFNRLSPLSQKTLDYAYKLELAREQRDVVKEMLAEHFRKADAKRARRVNKSNYSGYSIREKDEIDISEYQLSKEGKKNKSGQGQSKKQKPGLEHLFQKRRKKNNSNASRLQNSWQHGNSSESAKTLQKQKHLIQKYGFTNQYQSILEQKSIILRKNRKIILPQIRSQLNIYI